MPQVSPRKDRVETFSRRLHSGFVILGCSRGLSRSLCQSHGTGFPEVKGKLRSRRLSRTSCRDLVTRARGPGKEGPFGSRTGIG